MSISHTSIVRLAGDDPLGHHLADAAGARQAVRAEARRDEEAATSVSPRQNSLSGVNASGPLISRVTVIVVHRRHAAARVDGDLLEARPVLLQQAPVEVGRDRVDAGRRRAPTARRRARSRPSPAPALLAEVDEQVGVAQRRQVLAGARSRNGCVTRYSCAIGTIGTRTPAIRPISAANMPPALTTTSASIGPHSVWTPRTRPSSTSMPVTRVWVKIRTPPARAPSASA